MTEPKLMLCHFLFIGTGWTLFSWIFHGRLKGALSFWGLVIYDVCYEDLCYEDALTIKEAVELIYEMIEDHEYNRGRDLSEWRISKLHRSILLFLKY